MGTGGLPPSTMEMGEFLSSVMGMGGFPPMPWQRQNYPTGYWILKKREEPKWYEVHSLRERYNQLKVESSQPFTISMVGQEHTHEIHV